MRVSFVRHGQTDLNKQMRLQGRIDAPLNGEGIEQARRLSKKLNESQISYDIIYSSPLSRAVDTARIATGKDDIITDERLLEYDYGKYDGVVVQDLPAEIRAFLHSPEKENTPEGLESDAHVMARAGSFLKDLEKMDPEVNILVGAHGFLMFSCWGHIIGDGINSYWKNPMDNCEIRTAEFSDGEWKMI